MSRCFPYPPPGYKLRASNEALIESIKLQKERERAKAEKAKAERKKEKRREKDEKKKLKKEKAKPNTSEYDSCGAKSWGNSKDGILQKERKDDAEQLERSSITEEHELAQNPSYSSDSTQNSNKRKRQTSVSNVTHVQGASATNGTRVQGNILRIRLPSQKNIKCDIRSEKQQLSSASVSREIPDTVASRVEPDKSCSVSVATPGIAKALPPLVPDNEREPHSQQTPVYSEEVMLGHDHRSKRLKKIPSVVQKYRNLIENWIPPSLQQLLPEAAADEDWLFGKKHEQKRIHLDKTNGVDNQIFSSCSTQWPAAQYLPDADIYALPYAVPF